MTGKTILHHADFLTMEEARPSAEAVLVEDGRIRAAGSLKELCRLEPEAGLWDLEGAVVLPGFVDAHSHITAVAQNLQLANLRPSPAGTCDSPEDMIRILKEHKKEKARSGELGENGWIIGMGYDNSVFPGGAHPGTAELDQVSEEHPVAAVHVSGHICAVNKKAMEILGYTGENFTVPAGGTVEKSGVLKESAFFSPEKQRLMAGFMSGDLTELIGRASEYYASYGITTVQDAGITAAGYESLMKAGKTGLLKCDAVVYIPGKEAEEILPKENPTDVPYKNRVRPAGRKLFLDGSPQGKTAWLSEPYYEAPEGYGNDYCGSPAMSDEAVTEVMERCIRNHWQINVHANGDAAIEQMIRCYEEAAGRAGIRDLSEYPGAGLRPVIIHCQTARRDQIERMGRDGILASFFNDHVYYWGDYHYESVLGPERAENISPLSWARQCGVPFTLHQDSPVVPPDILLAVQNAVERKTRKGRILGAEHRISVMEALRAVTLGAAYQIFEEKEKGSICPGKRADFVILDRNPLETPASEIEKIRVLRTIKDGETIYSAKKDCNL